MRKNNIKADISTVRRRFPNLKSLKAFEAVARHESFTLAAHELAISQGAVSHQVKNLEEQLQLKLFNRHSKGISITSEGILLRDTCTRAFDDIASVINIIRPELFVQSIRVLAGPFFSMKVIAPRVASFMQANPEVQLHLNSIERADVGNWSSDVLIQYCEQPPEDKYAIEVLQEKMVPICSPALVSDAASPLSILEREEVTLLHYRDLSDWESWLAEAQLEHWKHQANLIIDDQQTIVEAVKAGQGIGMADRSLIRDEISRGEILVMSDQYVTPKASYKLICDPERLQHHPFIAIFRDWLIAEIRAIQQDTEKQ